MMNFRRNAKATKRKSVSLPYAKTTFKNIFCWMAHLWACNKMFYAFSNFLSWMGPLCVIHCWMPLFYWDSFQVRDNASKSSKTCPVGYIAIAMSHAGTTGLKRKYQEGNNYCRKTVNFMVNSAFLRYIQYQATCYVTGVHTNIEFSSLRWFYYQRKRKNEVLSLSLNQIKLSWSSQSIRKIDGWTEKQNCEDHKKELQM